MDDYKNLVNFWDNNFKLSEEDKKEFDNIDSNDYMSIAPSAQIDLSIFKGCKNVLDYGCGTGWASVIMAKHGVDKITAVDVSSNSIELTKLYAKAFNVSNHVYAKYIDSDWLKNEDSNKYDGFFSSNVIDVIPLDMAKDIIKEASRVVKKNSIVMFSLNYYIDPNVMAKAYEVNGSHIYIDGVLRLNSLTDDEWKEIFSEYFEVVDTKYFRWAGEDSDKRRYFILKK